MGCLLLKHILPFLSLCWYNVIEIFWSDHIGRINITNFRSKMNHIRCSIQCSCNFDSPFIHRKCSTNILAFFSLKFLGGPQIFKETDLLGNFI